MPKNNLIFFIFILLLNGCSSSVELKKKADNNTKAGDYYESIGQTDTAKQAREMARKNRKDSNSIETMIFDIVFGESDK